MGKSIIDSPNNGDMGGVTKGQTAKIGGNSRPVYSPNPTDSPSKGGGIKSNTPPIKSPVEGK